MFWMHRHFKRDIQLAVVVNESISEMFKVERGYRQDERIPAYLLIHCVKILAIMIR